MAPSTAPPAPTGAITLPTQLIKIQERPFRLGARFALNRHVGLRRYAKALR